MNAWCMVRDIFNMGQLIKSNSIQCEASSPDHTLNLSEKKSERDGPFAGVPADMLTQPGLRGDTGKLHSDVWVHQRARGQFLPTSHRAAEFTTASWAPLTRPTYMCKYCTVTLISALCLPQSSPCKISLSAPFFKIWFVSYMHIWILFTIFNMHS